MEQRYFVEIKKEKEEEIITINKFSADLYKFDTPVIISFVDWGDVAFETLGALTRNLIFVNKNISNLFLELKENEELTILITIPFFNKSTATSTVKPIVKPVVIKDLKTMKTIKEFPI